MGHVYSSNRDESLLKSDGPFRIRDSGDEGNSAVVGVTTIVYGETEVYGETVQIAKQHWGE